MTFKIGDRVACYTADGRRCGIVTEVFSEKCIRLDYGKGQYPTKEMGWVMSNQVHPKQCRRLKTKKRREIWINLLTGQIYYTQIPYSPDYRDFVRFVEARKK